MSDREDYERLLDKTKAVPDRLKGYLLQYRHRNYVRRRNAKREQEEAAATM